jgi:hypothetical protein
MIELEIQVVKHRYFLQHTKVQNTGIQEFYGTKQFFQ